MVAKLDDALSVVVTIEDDGVKATIADIRRQLSTERDVMVRISDGQAAKLEELRELSHRLESAAQEVSNLSSSINDKVRNATGALQNTQTSSVTTVLSQINASLDTFARVGGELEAAARLADPVIAQTVSLAHEFAGALDGTDGALQGTRNMVADLAEEVSTLESELAAIRTSQAWSMAQRYASTNPEDANFIAPQGMGWFPGYVIDVETGMRLNVAFGEDSYYQDSLIKGRDMIFNPAKLQKLTVEDNSGLRQVADPAIYRGANQDPVFGGKHFVYIWRADSIAMPASSQWKDMKNFAYDGGQLLFNSLNYVQSLSNNSSINVMNTNLYKLLMWVGMPMGIEGMTWLPEGNDCRIRIRIAKPYAPGYGYYSLQTPNEELNINNYNPKYTFSIDGWDPVENDPVKTEEDLNLVTVVPNPYYAYNRYESNALTNKVKITNLPNKCIVSIYTLSGTKVRQFRKDNEEPSVEWDLTNFANTPVASGFYLIHIKDLTSGSERTIKFFGAMREVDLNTF